MEAFSLNRVEIDLGALQDNYRSIVRAAGSKVRVMAVVKADAYGHGLVPCARALYRAGARTFGVAEVREGVALRSAGIRGDIVVLLGCTPETYAEIIRHDLIPVVFDVENITGLSREAAGMQASVKVHLKVDVGMGRLGVLPPEIESYIPLIRRLPGITLAGLLSHFPVADVTGAAARTGAQLESFKKVLAVLKKEGNKDVVAHIANSAALINFPETHLDMIRPGISLYGYYPDGATAGTDSYEKGIALKPVMNVKTRVVQVKELDAGCGISYGHTFITRRKSRIAVLPFGYADGFLRRLSNRAVVLVGGGRAPVCGRVCMNATMVDVTDLGRVRRGDEVVILGCQGDEEITADEIGGWLETISYEVLCTFGSGSPRFYHAE